MGENFEKNNPIVEKILNQIDPAILKTFSQEQLTAIRTSIYQNLPSKKKHSLEVRGTIPLFFRRIYVVFFSGKDERKKDEKDVPFELREKTALRDALAFLGLVPFVFSVFEIILIGYIAPRLYG